MELEEVKTAWKSANQRIEEMQAVQSAMQNTILKGQTQSTANRLMREPIFELIMSILVLFWAGGFLADNLAKIPSNPLGAIPSALVYALALFTVGLSIRQLYVISTLDFSAPIVEAQGKVATLRSWRVRSTQFMLLVGFGLWFVFPLFVLQSLGGYDVIKVIYSVNANWAIGNLVFAALVSVAVIVAARKYGERSKFFRAINNILAGDQIAAAERQLAEVADFTKA